jgi:hypothetical protein
MYAMLCNISGSDMVADVLRIRIMLCNVMIDVDFLSKTQARLRDVFAKPDVAIGHQERHMLQILAGSELLRNFFHQIFNNSSDHWPALSAYDAAQLLEEINSLNDMITALGRKTIEQMAIAVCHMARAMIFSCSFIHDQAVVSVQAAFLKLRASARYLGYAHPSLLWCLHAQIDVCLRACRMDLAQRVLAWEREMASFCPKMQRFFDEDEEKLSKLQFSLSISGSSSSSSSSSFGAVQQQPSADQLSLVRLQHQIDPSLLMQLQHDMLAPPFDDAATPPSPLSATNADTAFAPINESSAYQRTNITTTATTTVADSSIFYMRNSQTVHNNSPVSPTTTTSPSPASNTLHTTTASSAIATEQHYDHWLSRDFTETSNQSSKFDVEVDL